MSRRRCPDLRTVSPHRWVYVTPSGHEIDYQSQPTEVPTLRVGVTAVRSTFVREYTLTCLRPLVAGETNIVYPKGFGWRFDGVIGESARWIRKRPLETGMDQIVEPLEGMHPPHYPEDDDIDD